MICLSLRAEIVDIMYDLNDLDNLAFELESWGKPLNQYRYWIKHAIGYTACALEALGMKGDITRSMEIDSYAGVEDLKDLTKRVSINYSRIIMAYEKEAGDELNQILHIIKLCIAMMKASL